MKVSILCAACSVAFFGLSSAAQTKAPTLSANKTQACYGQTDRPKLDIKAGSGKTTYVSGVINDPTDPAATDGILFTADNQPTSFDIKSTNSTVVPQSNIEITHLEGDEYKMRIVPTGVGYTTISIKASNGKASAGYKIEYAASGAHQSNSFFPTGISDASAAIALGDEYMIVGDDETNLLCLYSRQYSGQALYKTDISRDAAGSGEEEFDMEGASLSSRAYNNGQRIYWIGSLGNGKNGGLKPYRNRVIATDIKGSGASATVEVTSYSTSMRQALIDWGDANAWHFSTSASLNPKRVDGFNVEGISIAHEGETAYIGFRAPLVPLQGQQPNGTNRRYAVVAPVSNFESMMNVPGKTGIKPTLGEPLLFDLDGLSIRDMVRGKGQGYLIVAGLYKGGGTPALYLWDGSVPQHPGLHPLDTTNGITKLPIDLSDLVQHTGGAQEGFPEAVLCETKNDSLYIQLICDSGTVDFYQDGTPAKSLTRGEYKKFRVASYLVPLKKQ